jgi:acetyl-CoA carboxylase biotin carboxyl carrier protein
MCLSSKLHWRRLLKTPHPVLDVSLQNCFKLKRFSRNRGNLLDSKDIKEIKAVIDLMTKHDLSVFEIEKEGFRLKLERGALAPQGTTLVPATATGPARVAATGPETPLSAPKSVESVPMKEIVSPMVGTFYRAASPDAPSFVEVGKAVTPDTVVCIIEAMKVMNEIKAEITGVIAEVIAENGKPVQFGQALFRVR